MIGLLSLSFALNGCQSEKANGQAAESPASEQKTAEQNPSGKGAANPDAAAQSSTDSSSGVLSQENKKQITEDIEALLAATYPADVEKIQNIRIEWNDNRPTAQGEKQTSTQGMTVYADLTTTRDPRQTPLILGMNKALEEAGTEREKAVIRKYIDGHLKEIVPYHHKTVTSNFPMRVETASKSGEASAYQLYYVETMDGKDTAYPAKAYFDQNFKEDAGKREQMGYEMAKEAAKNKG